MIHPHPCLASRGIRLKLIPREVHIPSQALQMFTHDAIVLVRSRHSRSLQSWRLGSGSTHDGSLYWKYWRETQNNSGATSFFRSSSEHLRSEKLRSHVLAALTLHRKPSHETSPIPRQPETFPWDRIRRFRQLKTRKYSDWLPDRPLANLPSSLRFTSPSKTIASYLTLSRLPLTDPCQHDSDRHFASPKVRRPHRTIRTFPLAIATQRPIQTRLRPPRCTLHTSLCRLHLQPRGRRIQSPERIHFRHDFFLCLDSEGFDQESWGDSG